MNAKELNTLADNLEMRTGSFTEHQEAAKALRELATIREGAAGRVTDAMVMHAVNVFDETVPDLPYSAPPNAMRTAIISIAPLLSGSPSPNGETCAISPEKSVPVAKLRELIESWRLVSGSVNLRWSRELESLIAEAEKSNG